MGRRLWVAAAAGGALVAGGVGVAIGPGAAWLVDQLADGQRIWRLGHIRVDGVSGAWLGNLHAAHVAIADDDGVWLTADHVALDWRPQDIAFGAVRIDAAHVEHIRLLRQPRLLEQRPPSDASVDVHIANATIEAIALDEAAFGAAAAFTAHLVLDVRNRSLEELDIALERTDSNADRLIALFRPGENYALRLEALSAPGGIFARALGVSEHGLRAEALGAGDAAAGDAEFTAHVGQTTLVEGDAHWTPADWRLATQAQLDALPALETLARRIGRRASLQASGARIGAFVTHAETPFLKLDLSGARDENGHIAGSASFTATTDRLSDIARESPFTLGAARLAGEVRGARGTIAIRATLDAPEIDALGEHAHFTGPVRAALTAERFTLESDLRVAEDAGPLFAQGHVRTQLEYDRARRRFALDSAQVNTGAFGVDAQGWASGGDGEFGGEWRVRRLEAFPLDLTGEARGRWRAFTEARRNARVWVTSVEGQGAQVGGDPSIVAQMLGAAPRLDGRFTFENRGLTVSHVRLDGAQLRAAATGHIVNGQANLALEASARGPLSLGGAQIAGAADARGQLTGRLARPTITAQATLTRFDAAGASVEQPVIDFTLTPAERSYAGRAEVHGQISGQSFAAASPVIVENSAITLPELTASVGALSATGSATVAAPGVTANFTLSGALDGLVPGLSGRTTGAAALTPERIVLDAQISDARSGELFVRAAAVHAEGPYENLAARIDLRGRLGQAPLTFAGTGSFREARSAHILRMDGRGALANADVFTRAPIEARFDGDTTTAAISVALGDGVLSGEWRERRRTLSGSAVLNNTPLAPIAAIWGETAEGIIDGRFALADAGGGLRGNADIALNDARFAGRQRGRLNMRVRADLDPTRLRMNVDATSTDGLVATLEADAPVLTGAAPIRIALAPERRGRATWSVRGPAASVWAAARLPDQTLDGQITGEGELSFGAGYLAGDGGIQIANGRLEDKLTGVTLENLDARVALDRRGVTIERFTAQDGHGGRLTMSGGSANTREGHIAVSVANMRIADRPDARATASGDLSLAWEGLHSTLSGTLNVGEADLDIAARAEAGIPTIDVIEINRPDQADDALDPAAPAQRRNGSTVLDVAIRAPGRVFTRGRGVDAEWSLDMRLAGTARAPRLYGEAQAMRGTLSLSGAPFEFENALITFSGDPLDAQIELKAARQTADLTAYINLTGTARDPEVSFTSDPGLPEDEILPQVLFGRSVADLSGFEAAQLAASLATLSGRASLDLVGAARAAVGLDRFNVRQDADGGFLVAGGVYLTRDVYVEVARSGVGETQSRVEWTMRPRLVLITSFLSNGDQSVSLRWRRESD